MIVFAKAPLRLGLAGGGSDVSPYCDIWGGAVLSATIDLYARARVEEIPRNEIIIDSADTATKAVLPLSEMIPTDCGAPLIAGVYNNVMQGLPKRGLRISTSNDAPIGSGLGTSSTMVVCLLKCFSEYLGIEMSPYELSARAYKIEREELGFAGGRQDQYSAAFGGINLQEYLPDGSAKVSPLKLGEEALRTLEEHLLLFYTGRSRSSGAIIAEQQRNTAAGNETAIEAMHRIRESAYTMSKTLLNGDIDGFAAILSKAWEDKKKMAGAITNPLIQELFDISFSEGAMAGKISGAGGGGVLMLVVSPPVRERVASALEGLHLEGSRILDFKFTFEGAAAWK